MNSTMPTYHNDEIDLIAFLRVLWERKYVVVFITVLFGFTSIFIALTATPIFRADVVVTKEDDDFAGGSISLTRVQQVEPFQDFDSSEGDGGTASVDVPTVIDGAWVVDVLGMASQNPISQEIERYNINPDPEIAGSIAFVPIATTKTMEYINMGGFWAHIGASFAPQCQ